jgi:hypothetical protein
MSTTMNVKLKVDYTDDLTNRPSNIDQTSAGVSPNIATVFKQLHKIIGDLGESAFTGTTSLIYKGTIGTGGTISTLPTASSSNNGYCYNVITDGTYSTIVAKKGDWFISNGSAWNKISFYDAADITDDILDQLASSGDPVPNATHATSADSATTATTAGALDVNDTAVGSSTQPVYFTSSGVPTAITNTIQSDVPKNAVFTDENVKQTPTSTNSTYEVLFSGSADNTEHTENVRKSNGLTFNPSTGVLSATSFSGGVAYSSLTNTPTTISGYGITDASISGNTITLGSNSVTPLTSSNVTSTYSSTGTDPVNGTAVAEALATLPDPMVFKGTLGASADTPTITALPVDGSATIGDTYKVITDGTYASQVAKIGDTFICLTKTSSSNTWVHIPSGDEPSGTVTSVGVSGNGIITDQTNSGPITTSGTISLALKSTTGLTTTAGNPTDVADKTYPVALDSAGNLAVNVNWSDTNTNRAIKVNGTQVLADNTTTALDLQQGSNVTISELNGTVTIAATDTTYTNQSASSGGTDLSLVTTGEKYIWNNMVSNVSYDTSGSNPLLKKTINGTDTTLFTVDTTATQNSTNPISSGAVYTIVGDINSVLESVL